MPCVMASIPSISLLLIFFCNSSGTQSLIELSLLFLHENRMLIIYIGDICFHSWLVIYTHTGTSIIPLKSTFIWITAVSLILLTPVMGGGGFPHISLCHSFTALIAIVILVTFHKENLINYRQSCHVLS